jgi:hypothetical protein
MTEKIPDTFHQLIGTLYSSQIRDVDDWRVQIGESWVSHDQRRRPRGRRVVDAFDVICETCCNK